jgi:hypothetical protein
MISITICTPNHSWGALTIGPNSVYASDTFSLRVVPLRIKDLSDANFFIFGQTEELVLRFMASFATKDVGIEIAFSVIVVGLFCSEILVKNKSFCKLLSKDKC